MTGLRVLLMSTIFALSSGILPSAIALFRLSGVRSLPVLREITRKEKWEPRRLNYVKIYSLDGDILDKAMAVYMPGPSTFTGEDTAELFVHGSRAVADALGSRLAGIEGVRQAIRGEFTKRAFYNNKMDLSEVHGLRSLINAETQRQRQMSFVQMQGGSIARRIRDQLADVVMRSFILMDFGEHVDSTIDEVKSLVSSILSEVNLLENRARGFEIVQRGLRAVLVGRPNTGKSSLLNALARRDVAIVSEQAGTTRDSIEVRLDIGGVPVSLTDTAGMRNTVDFVEIKGIERTKEKITDADLVLIVVNATDNANEFEEILRELQDLCQKSQPIIMIKNKCDLLPTVSTQDLSKLELSNITDCVSTCALSHEGVSPLVFSLQKFIENLCPSDIGPWLSDRQLLREAGDELSAAMSVCDSALLCQHLQSALDIFGQMTGTTVSEQILDDLFRQFCIGK